ncbi:hypothetical protein OIO90_004883 [Microbotryomycetes sp. JL221]|nr:hypothetical protein OIO90_004883 [Microbotryomycetes sp. JL221]
MATTTTTSPTEIRHDLSMMEKEFDVASSQFTKDGPTYLAMDAEVAAVAAQDWKAVKITPEENKRLYRMVVKRVLTIMLGTYFIQGLDKSTMSFAAIMNIREDTGMVGQQYAWLTTILYLGILVMEFPVSQLVRRFPVSRILAAAICAWGVAVACTAACHNWAGLMVCRFILGAAESSVQPCLLLLTSTWFTRGEQAAVVSYWYSTNGIQQAVGGLLAFGVAHIKNGPLHAWQVLFILLGGLTVFWAAFVLWWMPSTPVTAKCFNEQDRTLLLERVRENQSGVQSKVFRKDHIIEALTDPQVWTLCLLQILNTVPTGGYGAFGNLIIKSFGFSTLQTSLLSIGQGGVHVMWVLLGAFVATRFPRIGRTGVALLCVFPMVGATVVLMTVSPTPSTKNGLLAAFYTGFALTFAVATPNPSPAPLNLCFLLSNIQKFNAQAVMIISSISSNIGGVTKKTFVIAMTFVAWCTGNMIGPQVFRASDAPRYRKGFAVHLGFYAAQVITLVFLRLYYLRQNASKKTQRIEKYGEQAEDEVNLDNAFDDLSDRQNMHFRYQW